MLRAVLDTNVVLAARGASNPGSPNREIMAQWRAGRFVLLLTLDMVAEYVEKLLEMGKPESEVEVFAADLLTMGETVAIRFFHLRHYPADADDIAFVLCALNGAATHLVTYDAHLLNAGCFYLEFVTCEPVPFLAQLRAVAPV
jgi:predicted nucleic acid-binding protein